MEALERLEKHWRWWVLLFWLAAAGLLLWTRWGAVQAFALGDTDDNLRMMQVRALLDGQGWYDLRQYRLNPPFGADVHWSRLVDLPIAGIKLALAPLIGGAAAERAAVAAAPMLPMGVAMAALAVVSRRLVHVWAFPLAIAILLCGHSVRGMWSPLRIDHHGWQLALLAVAAASLTDPKRARGGAILGVASACSLVIGMEMLLYLAFCGAAVVLMWIRDGGQARRLVAYGASFSGTAAIGYLLFASYANRAPVCDALSPVWLSAVVAAGAVAVALGAFAPRSWAIRLGAAAGGGALLAVAFILVWPGCVGRLEQASPQLVDMWLSNVREARAIYLHPFMTQVSIASLPAAGLVGYALMLLRHSRDEARLVPWLALAALALLAAGLLLWQTRAAPAAQLLAVPGATALAWLVFAYLWRTHWLAGLVGLVLAFFVASGLLAQQGARLLPQKAGPGNPAVDRANRLCPTLWALKPVAQQPRGYVLTFVDLGPRLIAVTPHDAVAGPYHRNAQDIIDTMAAFRGTPEAAYATIRKRGIGYVLICPGLSESTLHASRAKNGFYVQLAKGKVPEWLEPVPLPKDNPYRMWRVVRP